MPTSSRPAVALTREPADNAALAALLREDGWRVVEWPATSVRPITPPGGAEALAARVRTCDAVAFTSRRGVHASLRVGGDALRTALAGVRRAAVGPATAAALADIGLAPEWVGRGRGAEELVATLAGSLPPGGAISLLRSAAADDALPEGLRRAGLRVEDVRVYEPVDPARPADIAARVDVIACASPSAARRVLEWRPDAVAVPFVAIGPTTARALRQLGVARVETAPGTSPADVRGALRAALGGDAA